LKHWWGVFSIFSEFFLAEHGVKMAELGASAHVFLYKIQRCLILTEDVGALAVFLALFAIVALIKWIAA
jgi:hypothetical protein